MHGTAHCGVNGPAGYETTSERCKAYEEMGTLENDTVKCSTDHGHYVFISLPFAYGMSTTELIESESSVESDNPADATSNTR